jgi:hypothetical protein
LISHERSDSARVMLYLLPENNLVVDEAIECFWLPMFFMQLRVNSREGVDIYDVMPDRSFEAVIRLACLLF